MVRTYGHGKDRIFPPGDGGEFPLAKRRIFPPGRDQTPSLPFVSPPSMDFSMAVAPSGKDRSVVFPPPQGAFEVPAPKKTKLTDYLFKKIMLDEEDPGREAKRVPGQKHFVAKKPRAQQQAFLDFGQKTSTIIECKECNLCYDRSFAADVKRHEMEHKRRDLLAAPPVL